MERKKLIKIIAASLLGAVTLGGGIFVGVQTAKVFSYYRQIEDYTAQMRVYEQDPNHPYLDPTTEEYAAYNALADADREVNRDFDQASAPLPYMAVVTFVSAGVLIYLGVDALSHSRFRERRN